MYDLPSPKHSINHENEKKAITMNYIHLFEKAYDIVCQLGRHWNLCIS